MNANSQNKAPLPEDTDQLALFEMPSDSMPEDLVQDGPIEITAAAVDVRERAKLLNDSLGHLAEVSMRVGLEKAVHTGANDRIKRNLGPGYEGTLKGAAFTREQEMKRAKASFLASYNMGLEQRVNDEDPDFKVAFAEFSYKYGVGANPEQTARKRERRQKFQKVLGRLARIQGAFTPDTYTEDQPAVESPVVESRQIPLEPELARTKDKLIGLRDDTRAGFLPTTHTEKNQAFELLDYLNLEKHPRGVDQRLDEIFRHQQKIGREKGLRGREIYRYAQDAVRSVVFEWSDHLQSAIISHDQLSAMQAQLTSGISPHISTYEATEPEDGKTFDYNVLVRFVNLKSLRDGKALQFDPLRTKEDRSIEHPDKNKIIEDVHTAVGSIIEIQQFIDEVANQLSVKDSQVLLKEALADQAARRIFWYRALQAVSEEGFQEMAQQALKNVMKPGTV